MGLGNSLRNAMALRQRAPPPPLVTKTPKPQPRPQPRPQRPEKPSNPGDAPPVIQPGLKVSAEQIHELNELIRKRYELDFMIWKWARICAPRDQVKVKAKMRSADAALVKIKETLQIWDDINVWNSREDHLKLKAISYTFNRPNNGIRVWANHPDPWERQAWESEEDMEY